MPLGNISGAAKNSPAVLLPAADEPPQFTPFAPIYAANRRGTRVARFPGTCSPPRPSSRRARPQRSCAAIAVRPATTGMPPEATRSAARAARRCSRCCRMLGWMRSISTTPGRECRSATRPALMTRGSRPWTIRMSPRTSSSSTTVGRRSRHSRSRPSIARRACGSSSSCGDSMRESTRSEVDLQRRTVRVEYRPAATSPRRIAEQLAELGYEPVLAFEGSVGPTPDRRRLYLQLGVAGFAFGNIMLFSIPRYVNGGPLTSEFRLLFGGLNVAPCDSRVPVQRRRLFPYRVARACGARRWRSKCLSRSACWSCSAGASSKS